MSSEAAAHIRAMRLHIAAFCRSVDAALVAMQRAAGCPAASDARLELICEAVLAHYRVTMAQLISEDRSPIITEPRHVCIFLARELTNIPQQHIAEAFGREHHGTVIHATRAIRDRMDTDATFAELVNRLKHSVIQSLAAFGPTSQTPAAVA